jgi:hypothetical protein
LSFDHDVIITPLINDVNSPSLLVWHKSVADAVDGEESFGVGGIGFDFLAELGDVLVEGSGGSVVFDAPNVVE